MGAMPLYLLLACSSESFAFTSTSNRFGFRPATSPLLTADVNTRARRHASLSVAEGRSIMGKLSMVGKDLNPEQMLPLNQDNLITPEGFGFSSTMGRVLDIANRSDGYYSAMASDIVTDVMEEITNGQADVALVFQDDNTKFEGIFTESDYIEVSCFTKVNLTLFFVEGVAIIT